MHNYYDNKNELDNQTVNLESRKRKRTVRVKNNRVVILQYSTLNFEEALWCEIFIPFDVEQNNNKTPLPSLTYLY